MKNPFSSAQETTIWVGRPSQVLNLKYFVVGVLLCWLVIPVFYALWKWLVVRNIEYTLTDQRLRVRSGVLNKQVADLELYRVKDFQVHQPLWLRFFSLSHIALATSDRSHPQLLLAGVADGEELKDAIRDAVEDMRQMRGVREIDR
ncbi:Bacterial membrane flanked domain protein [compost metagenome]